jgi:DNA-binding response OmpR family regulator
MRVLLIEDDRSIAQSIELMLKSESFNIYSTDLGQEGVELAAIMHDAAHFSGLSNDRAVAVRPARSV